MVLPLQCTFTILNCFHCSYDILAENLMDPSHVPYAHKGLIGGPRNTEDPGRYVPDLTHLWQCKLL
jgi:phenylpropionate dioxygenase-like ring-hydroxylating dioxygenase large terminal subunit